MGEDARLVIDCALTQLGIDKINGATIKTIEEDKVSSSNGLVIPASTAIWCAGMRANSLARTLGVKCDTLGRLYVDQFMRASDLTDVFAAGDIANAKINDEHEFVMSCQHGRPMGRFAGHNVVADLLKLPMLPLRIDIYSTCVDLGSAGAVYTRGIKRKLLASGPAAKETKNTINRVRIYPPAHRARGRHPGGICSSRAAAASRRCTYACVRPGCEDARGLGSSGSWIRRP